LPTIRHVFVIMLENEGYAQTFGTPSNDPYLATILPREGALLENYYAVGHFSLDNYIAFISGQPPNADTQGDCLTGYVPFPSTEGQEKWDDATGIQEGMGCVYPSAVQTLANQLAGKGLTWKGYMEDMGNDPQRDGAPAATCGHPASGAPGAVTEESGDGYATRHDPFVYFGSIVGSPMCDSDVVPLGSTTGAMPSSDTAGAAGLVTDLKSISTTPNFSFITPNLCNDGHDAPPCAAETAPGTTELADVNAFLSTWVPIITSSPAFKQDGLLMVTFDESDTSDTTSCCSEEPGPTGVAPGQNNGPGGGRIGSVLVSPFIKGGDVVTTELDHYSALASIEDLFGLSRLGDAQTVRTTFDSAYDK